VPETDSASVVVPKLKTPALFSKNQCLLSAEALVSVRYKYGNVEAILRSPVGLVVPMPTLPVLPSKNATLPALPSEI